MSQEIASAISKISAELTGDAQTMARLVGQPLVAYPGDCWLSPAAQVRVLGERVNLRYWLYETLTQAPVGPSFSLRALATCVSPDCVNPAHQARKLRQKPGRKPGQAPMQRSRSAVDVAWPDPATILMLMVLEPNAWPDECRTRCWEWTGPVQPMGIHRLPKLKIASVKVV